MTEEFIRINTELLKDHRKIRKNSKNLSYFLCRRFHPIPDSSSKNWYGILKELVLLIKLYNTLNELISYKYF